MLDRLVQGLLADEPDLARYRDRPKHSTSSTSRPRYPNGLDAGARRTRTPPAKPSRRSDMPKTSSHSVRHDALPEDHGGRGGSRLGRGVAAAHPEIVRIGYFGSYAAGITCPAATWTC